MINRRDFLGLTVSAGATLAISPDLLRGFQQQGGKLIEKAIPSTGEKLPVVGLSFSNHVSCADHGALRQVFKTFVDNGGRVYDAVHGNAASEQFHTTIANELGVQNKLFWMMRATPPGGPGGPPPAGPATVNNQIDSLLASTKASKIDLATLGVNADPTWWAALRDEKKAGRVRYIGLQSIVVKNQSAQIEAMMRNEPLDFIGVDYDISNRHAEETILPLALEKKIAVIAFFPFSNNTGVSCGTVSRNLFARVGSTPLPAWAADFDAKSWAQFFLKYVVSHPAIIAARVGTTKSSHMLDNLGGGMGRLPDEATRKKMAAFIDAFPPLPPMPAPPPNPAAAPGIALTTAVLDRYIGEWKTPGGMTISFRREGTTLFVKPGPNPEVPLNARTETRLQDPRGPVFEFQVDGQGKVTGLILEQGNPVQKTPLVKN